MTDRWTRPEFDRIALITIDVQIDTLDGQPFEISGTSQALPQIAAMCDVFREQEKPLVHVLRLYRPDGSNAELCRRDPLAGCAPRYPHIGHNDQWQSPRHSGRIFHRHAGIPGVSTVDGPG